MDDVERRRIAEEEAQAEEAEGQSESTEEAVAA
jgi:hypothetical protein